MEKLKEYLMNVSHNLVFRHTVKDLQFEMVVPSNGQWDDAIKAAADYMSAFYRLKDEALQKAAEESEQEPVKEGADNANV